MPEMPARDALVEHCLELLSSVGSPTARPMFGGHGLRVDGVFLALIAFDRLYLKVDAECLPQFEAAACEPFVYPSKGKPATMNYRTVPPQAMDSPAQMRPWALLALDAALRAVAARRRAQARKQRTTRRVVATRPSRGRA